jgi:hypothetical protein
MTITLTREEAQSVLDAVGTAYGAACFAAAKILRDKLSEPNIVQDAIVYGTGITKDGKRIDPDSIYKEPEPPCKTGSQCIGGKCPQCVVREWQGLTDEEIKSLLWETRVDNLTFARVIEKVLREKNAS